VAAIAGMALLLVPATGIAADKFGARLNPSIQPSNSLPARPCTHQDPGLTCTQVLYGAYGRPGQPDSPRKGIIKRIRVIAGGPGSFRLQIARVKRSSINNTNESKVVRNGPVIHYQGQTDQNFDTDVYNVESFPVNVAVDGGDFLAIKSKFSSAFRCSGGGDDTLIYQPPLLAGGGFQDAKSTDGCFMLIEAVLR
jgi:hypothetical protein